MFIVKIIHNYIESALREAQRLAEKTMQPFEVLKIVAVAKPKTVCEVKLYD